MLSLVLAICGWTYVHHKPGHQYFSQELRYVDCGKVRAFLEQRTQMFKEMKRRGLTIPQAAIDGYLDALSVYDEVCREA